MSGNEEQIEIDLGDASKVEQQASEPELVIVDEGADSKLEAFDGEEKAQDPEKALKKLQKKLEKERKAREEAERNAREAIEKARQASVEAQDSRIHLVSGAIETLRRDDEILTAHLKQAMEIGDFDRAAEIQKTLAVNANKMVELERGYNDLKNSPPPPPVQQQDPSAPNIDDIIQRVTPRSAEWLRENRKHLPDSRSIRIMARAHDDAIDHGIIPESDQYFRFVEDRLGIGKKKDSYERDDAMSSAAKATKNRQSPPSAPVSRQPVDNPGRPGVIRLTAEQVEAAKISGISPQEYYKLMMQDRNRN
jgi:hypothetical protein